MARPQLRSTTLLLALAAACASSSGKKESDSERMRVEAYSPDAKLEHGSIGAQMASLDRSLQTWNQIFLTGNERDDLRKLKGLAEDIGFRTSRMFDEVVSQLETGPPYNRRVAAAALGFTHNDRARNPLLNALSDPDEQVVANALLGLSVLGDPLTPLEGVLQHMGQGTSEQVRSNAALAVLEILRNGGKGTENVRDVARRGLHDDAPLVRTQSALILAHQVDVASIQDLTLQLHEDPVNSASMAAARALAYIGSKEDTAMGRCARGLTSSLGKVKPAVRAAVLMDLQRLSGRNYAEDEDWIEWSHRLP